MTPIRHSYSSINRFNTCPAAWGYQYKDRLPQGPSGKAAGRGTALHSQAEKFFNRELPAPLSVEFWRIEDQMHMIRDCNPLVEHRVWLNKGWQITDEHGVNGPAMLLAIIDITFRIFDEIHVIDLKSGREYASHMDQLSLYATVMLATTDAEKIECSALYLDAGKFGAECSFPRAMLPELKAYWSDKMKVIEGATEFPRKPDKRVCSWCPYSVKKGGPCNEQ